MAIAMPSVDLLPAGPARSLLVEVFALYHAAGRPASRVISQHLRNSPDLEQVSHETVNLFLRGRSVPSWERLRSIVTALDRLSDHRTGPLDETLQRLYVLWREAVGEARAATQGKPSSPRLPDTTTSSGGQPFTIERMTVTHYLRGRSVQRSTTERWVIAEEADVSHFLVPRRVGGPHTPLVRPLLNCRRGTVRRTETAEGDAAEVVEILFPHPLRRREAFFFAIETTEDSGTETFFREVQETARAIHRITIRVQFDLDDMPYRCWCFGAISDVERLIPPLDGDSRYLFVSEAGYVEFEFVGVTPSAKYGIAWQWA